MEGAWVNLVIAGRILGEDDPDPHIRGISFHKKLELGDRHLQERWWGESGQERMEGCLRLWGHGVWQPGCSLKLNGANRCTDGCVEAASDGSECSDSSGFQSTEGGKTSPITKFCTWAFSGSAIWPPKLCQSRGNWLFHQQALEDTSLPRAPTLLTSLSYITMPYPLLLCPSFLFNSFSTALYC